MDVHCAQGPEEAPTEDTFYSMRKHVKAPDPNDGAKSAHVNVEQLEITGTAGLWPAARAQIAQYFLLLLLLPFAPFY